MTLAALWFLALVACATGLGSGVHSASLKPDEGELMLRGWPQADPAGCAAIEDIPIQGLNLTDQEKAVLSDICWRPELALERRQYTLKSAPSRGVPAGVDCDVTHWCDGENVCTEVCQRGTVRLNPWLDFALHTQLNLTRKLPFCYANLLGTHNSAISLSDGYGNLDEQFQEYFKWVKWVAGDAPLRTNDHWVSLTDQMNLGARALELDTHWVEDALRIAHCGGFHSQFNLLVRAMNVVAKLLGHPFHWDTETVGCNPSLSSIPVMEQRTFADALSEIRAWLDQPENAHEFVVLYLDDQIDLSLWGFVDQLLSDIKAAFPIEQIMTPTEHVLRLNSTWQSIDEMSAAGKRVLFVSASDYGEAMFPLIFSRNKAGPGGVCDWAEPSLEQWQGQPDCLTGPGSGPTLSGQFYRISSCEIMYGPFNCDFSWRPDNSPVLDVDLSPDVASCGLNMPSPDLLTPERAAAFIWTWAPGHPFTPSVSASLLSSITYRLKQLLGLADDKQCAVVSAQDARWRAVGCAQEAGTVTACRPLDGQQGWQLAPGPRGECPAGAQWAVPRHAKDNVALQTALQAAGASAAWLPLSGPDWQLPTS